MRANFLADDCLHGYATQSFDEPQRSVKKLNKYVKDEDAFRLTT